MYIDYILIFIDYLRTLRKRNAAFEILLPIIISFWIAFIIIRKAFIINYADVIDKIINVEGVLIGFSITTITFLTTASNDKITELKNKPTDKFLSGKNLSLFDIMIINYTYMLILQIIILIVSLFLPSFIGMLKLEFNTKVILFTSLMCFVLHNFLILIRNVSDIYFVLINFSKKQ